MNAVLIEHADGRKFLRSGECDGCKGRVANLCCTFIMLPLARALTDDEAKWVSLHPGVRVEGDSMLIESPCEALVDEQCSLFGTDERPAMCERFPEMPQQLLEGCAYQMKEVP